jgi:phenylalanyl-tRNA synthetase alpha chain
MPSPLEAKPDLAEQVLDALSHNDTITSALQFPTTSQAELKAALDRLRSRSMIDYEQLTQSHVVLGEEGQNICASASPEYTVWKAIRDKGKVGVKELAVLYTIHQSCVNS